MTFLLGAATALWFIFMTWLSHQDGEHTKKASLRLAEELPFSGQDKRFLDYCLRRAAHVTVFFVLTVLLELTLFTAGKSPYYAVLPCMIWAWIDETTKWFIKGRHFTWADVGLNILGVVIGLVPAVCLPAL